MINTEKTYYNFENVLIKPIHSFLDSRSQVNLNIDLSKIKKEVFKNWSPLPVMSANMDTVTDVELAWELLQRNWIPVLHKYVSIEEISKLFDKIDDFNSKNKNKIDYRKLFISRGTTEQDKSKLIERIQAEPRIQSVCIDVANGHRESVVSYAKELKTTILKDKILMLGNIGSSDMVESYIKAGVDIIKAGIGPGCFHEETNVITDTGFKKIKDVTISDRVFTHNNIYKKVISTTIYEEKDKLISINGILSTLEHKYLVVEKSNKEKKIWIAAKDLNKEIHLLTRHSFFPFEEIKQIEEIDFLGKVYDIEVEEDYSFAIDRGILVHNSACSTRVKTGVGMPQISLIDDIKNKIKELNAEEKILLVSDGGCKVEGDIAKALVAGADFVMIGGMLAGYKESPGTIEIVGEQMYKRFSGMAAKESQHNGVPEHGTEEGKTVMIKYKGKIYHKLNDIEGGLRSACTYVNASNIKDLQKAELIISTVQENKVFN
jgi:IMP dehydrogenase/GMP reductase